MAAKKSGKIIGLCCERCIDLTAHVEADGSLKANHRVKIITLPCSGMVQPSQLEQAVAKGASGAFVAGCAIGDCHYRTGNLMIRDRIKAVRAPKLAFKKINPERVAGIWVAKHEWDKFSHELSEFTEKVQTMDAKGDA